MYERFGIDRDPDVRRAGFRRVEENQVARLKVRPLHRHSNRELLDHGSGNHNPFGVKDVPDEPAAIEACPGIFTSEPIRRAAERQRLVNQAWRNNHGPRSSTRCRTAGKWGRADRALVVAQLDATTDRRTSAPTSAALAHSDRDSHTGAIGGGRPVAPADRSDAHKSLKPLVLSRSFLDNLSGNSPQWLGPWNRRCSSTRPTSRCASCTGRRRSRSGPRARSRSSPTTSARSVPSASVSSFRR